MQSIIWLDDSTTTSTPATVTAGTYHYAMNAFAGDFEMQKNVASQKLIVFAFDSTTNLPKSGDAANITAYVDIDFGGVTVLGDTSATELDATNAKGYYQFDLTQAETNGNLLLFTAKSATSNIVVLGVPALVQTVPVSFTSFTTPPTTAAIATGVWTDTTAGDFTTALSVGKSVMNGVTLGTGLTVARCTLTDTLTTYTGNTVQTGDSFARLTGTGAVTFASLTVTGAVAFQSTFAVTTSTSLAALSCTTLTASGAVAFQSTFAVTTSTSLAALSCTTMTASGAVAFQSTFATTGTTTFNAFTVTNALTVSGATIFTGAITGTSASNDLRINGAVPGASGGLFIAGTNAATVSISGAGGFNVASGITANITGNLSGSVGSVAGNVAGNVVGSVASVTAVSAGAITSASFGSGATIPRCTLVDTITTYTGNTVQTGDSFARIGAAGASLTAVGLAGTQTFSNTGTWTGNIVGTVSTLTTYTGNTPQTGDSFARIGVAGAGLTALGDARVANLDATVTSRMATYTQPPGFLAATFPASPAAVGDIPTAAQNATAVLTTQMTESYNADGTAPTLAQSLFVTMQRLTEFAIASTTITVKKLDGTTTAYALTMDSATAPTSATRSA